MFSRGPCRQNIVYGFSTTWSSLCSPFRPMARCIDHFHQLGCEIYWPLTMELYIIDPSEQVVLIVILIGSWHPIYFVISSVFHVCKACLYSKFSYFLHSVWILVIIHFITFMESTFRGSDEATPALITASLKRKRAYTAYFYINKYLQPSRLVTA